VTKSTLNRLDYRIKEWDEDMTKHVKSLEAKGKPVILGGDLNTSQSPMDMYKTVQKVFKPVTEGLRDSFNRFLASGYVDTFRHLYPGVQKHTAWSPYGGRKKNLGLRVDYFCCSQSMIDFVVDSEIHQEVLGSDHSPISLTIDLKEMGSGVEKVFGGG